MRQRIARTNLRAFVGSALGGALVGASAGLYAGSEGTMAGAMVGAAVGCLAGFGIVRTKAWGDARNRELDRHIYEPAPDPSEGEPVAAEPDAAT